MKGDEGGVVPELDLPAAACKRWWDAHALLMRFQEAVSPAVHCLKRESRAVEPHLVISGLLRTHRTRATSSRDEISFVTKSDGSSSSAWTSSSISRIVHVRNMTGTDFVASASVPLVASMTSKFAPLRDYRTKPLTAGSSSTTSIFCTVVLDIVASGPVSETYRGEGPIASERILKGPGAWLSGAG